MGIVVFVLVVVGLIAVAAANSNFKKETGTNAPTRIAMKGIRRRARKTGVSQPEYLNNWIERKKRKRS